MKKNSRNHSDWEKKLETRFKELDLLEGEDFKVYLELLKSRKDLTGIEIANIFPHLKRTHIYSILNRLQREGWIELIKPGSRPTLCRGINPQQNLEKFIERQEKYLENLKKLKNYVFKKITPLLTSDQIYGGRVSNTFIIPTLSELYQQINNYVESATNRLMFYVSNELFEELQEPILNSIKNLFEKFKEKKIQLKDEDRRDRFAMIVAGNSFIDKFKNKLPERLRIIKDPNKIQTQLFIVDDIVFISNMTSGFGLSLRISDKTVATTYAILISHIYLEKQIELMGGQNLEILGKHMKKSEIMKETIKELYQLGWKTLPEHTSSFEKSDDLGLASPGSERAFFRLCGIRYFPFNEEQPKINQVKELFENTVINGRAYLLRLRKQLKITGKKGQSELYGLMCMIFKIKYKLRKEWAPIIRTIPNLESVDEYSEGAAIATFNFDDKAAMCVWAINPNNVNFLLKTLSKNMKKTI